MTFAYPIWFLLFPVVIFLGLFRKRRPQPAVVVPTFMPIADIPRGRWVKLGRVPDWCRWCLLSLLVLALARPQKIDAERQRRGEGIDIMLVIDTSGSMRARDLVMNGERPSRLDVVKMVIKGFIGGRKDDRIGLVVFGSEAFTQAPLTYDYGVLEKFLEIVKVGVAGDATAIGDGLGTALKRLKDFETKSKIVILLTDGSNNSGRIDPVAAANAAQALGVKVYTVGVGSSGEVPMEINGMVQNVVVDIDEELLRSIAEKTGAKYFRATSGDMLVHVYEEIDRLEKSTFDLNRHQRAEEYFSLFLWPALGLFGLEILWGLTRFRRVT